jgi:hypothetical protein
MEPDAKRPGEVAPHADNSRAEELAVVRTGRTARSSSPTIKGTALADK